MPIGRVVAVTASIALIGAIIGAVIGGVLQSVAVLVAPGTTNEQMEIALVGALFGALIGAVLAPITAWVFLRRVPLGRAIAHTAIGATAGATLGLVIPLLGFRRFGGGTMLIGTLAGFLVAAVRLRLKTRVPVTPTLSDGSTT